MFPNLKASRPAGFRMSLILIILLTLHGICPSSAKKSSKKHKNKEHDVTVVVTANSYQSFEVTANSYQNIEVTAYSYVTDEDTTEHGGGSGGEDSTPYPPDDSSTPPGDPESTPAPGDTTEGSTPEHPTHDPEDTTEGYTPEYSTHDPEDTTEGYTPEYSTHDSEDTTGGSTPEYPTHDPEDTTEGVTPEHPTQDPEDTTESGSPDYSTPGDPEGTTEDSSFEDSTESSESTSENPEDGSSKKKKKKKKKNKKQQNTRTNKKPSKPKDGSSKTGDQIPPDYSPMSSEDEAKPGDEAPALGTLKRYDIPDISEKVARGLCRTIKASRIHSSQSFLWAVLKSPDQALKRSYTLIRPRFFPGCYKWRWSFCGGKPYPPLMTNCGFFSPVRVKTQECGLIDKNVGTKPKEGTKDCPCIWPCQSFFDSIQKCFYNDVKVNDFGDIESTELLPTSPLFLNHARAVHLCRFVHKTRRDRSFQISHIPIPVQLSAHVSKSDDCVQWMWKPCNYDYRKVMDSSECGLKSCFAFSEEDIVYVQRPDVKVGDICDIWVKILKKDDNCNQFKQAGLALPEPEDKEAMMALRDAMYPPIEVPPRPSTTQPPETTTANVTNYDDESVEEVTETISSNEIYIGDAGSINDDPIVPSSGKKEDKEKKEESKRRKRDLKKSHRAKASMCTADSESPRCKTMNRALGLDLLMGRPVLNRPTPSMSMIQCNWFAETTHCVIIPNKSIDVSRRRRSVKTQLPLSHRRARYTILNFKDGEDNSVGEGGGGGGSSSPGGGEAAGAGRVDPVDGSASGSQPSQPTGGDTPTKPAESSGDDNKPSEPSQGGQAEAGNPPGKLSQPGGEATKPEGSNSSGGQGSPVNAVGSDEVVLDIMEDEGTGASDSGNKPAAPAPENPQGEGKSNGQVTLDLQQNGGSSGGGIEGSPKVDSGSSGPPAGDIGVPPGSSDLILDFPDDPESGGSDGSGPVVAPPSENGKKELLDLQPAPSTGGSSGTGTGGTGVGGAGSSSSSQGSGGIEEISSKEVILDVQEIPGVSVDDSMGSGRDGGSETGGNAGGSSVDVPAGGGANAGGGGGSGGSGSSGKDGEIYVDLPGGASSGGQSSGGSEASGTDGHTYIDLPDVPGGGGGKDNDVYVDLQEPGGGGAAAAAGESESGSFPPGSTSRQATEDAKKGIGLILPMPSIKLNCTDDGVCVGSEEEDFNKPHKPQVYTPVNEADMISKPHQCGILGCFPVDIETEELVKARMEAEPEIHSGKGGYVLCEYSSGVPECKFVYITTHKH